MTRTSTVAFDLGAFCQRRFARMEGASWSAGLQVSNLGPKIKYPKSSESLPMMAKVGGSVDLPFSQMHRLMMTADLGYRLAPSDVPGCECECRSRIYVGRAFLCLEAVTIMETGKKATIALPLWVQEWTVTVDIWILHVCLHRMTVRSRNTFWATLGYSNWWYK